MTSFKTYWDYSDKERSQLTEDEVTRLLDAELMTKGVLRPPAPPVIKTVKDLDLPKKTFYQVQPVDRYSNQLSDLAFETMDEALTFASLRPVFIEKDWQTDSSFAKLLPELRVVAMQFADEHSVSAARLELQKIKADKDKNDQLLRDYKAGIDKVEKVTRGVWDDWHARKAEDAEVKKLIATFEQYTVLTKGDKDMAFSFLSKAFDIHTIRHACHWADHVALANVLEGIDIKAERPTPSNGADIDF